MKQYVVYYNPIDYPKKWVVREFKICGGQISAKLTPHIVSESKHAARASIPDGLVCLPRDEEDEPQIVEVWL